MQQLSAYGIKPVVTDPQASAKEVKHESGVDLIPFEHLRNMDCLVFAIAHDEYKNMSLKTLEGMFGDYPNNEKVIVDIKGALNKAEILQKGYRYWRL